MSLSISRSPSQNHCQKPCPHVFFFFFLFLGSIVMFIFISFHPLPTRHRVQQGDVNFSPDIRRSDTSAMDKIYSGVRHPRLTPVKHPHKTLQRTRFWLVLLSSAHVVPAAFISASVLLSQVCFRRPTLRFPCGFQSRACLVMLDAGFRSVWPIQLHYEQRYTVDTLDAARRPRLH